jgi:hypothetical protein
LPFFAGTERPTLTARATASASAVPRPVRARASRRERGERSWVGAAERVCGEGDHRHAVALRKFVDVLRGGALRRGASIRIPLPSSRKSRTRIVVLPRRESTFPAREPDEQRCRAEQQRGSGGDAARRAASTMLGKPSGARRCTLVAPLEPQVRGSSNGNREEPRARSGSKLTGSARRPDAGTLQVAAASHRRSRDVRPNRW